MTPEPNYKHPDSANSATQVTSVAGYTGGRQKISFFCVLLANYRTALQVGINHSYTKLFRLADHTGRNTPQRGNLITWKCWKLLHGNQWAPDYRLQQHTTSIAYTWPVLPALSIYINGSRKVNSETALGCLMLHV